jgi:membrane protease YdiL (CAAX protease family)
MLNDFLAVESYPLIDTERPFKGKLALLLKVYCIVFLVNFLSGPISLTCEYLVTHVLHYKSISAQYKTSMHAFFEKYGYWKALVYVSIIGPIIEELIFRLPLSFRKKHIAISFGFALMLILKALPGLKEQGLAINILARVVAFVVGYFTIVKAIPIPRSTSTNQTIKIRVIIGSIIVFGLLHTFNFAPFQLGVLYMYPLYVLPQLMMGWFLTYIRFKNGFAWGIALHIMINSTAMLMQSVFKLH